MRILKVAFVTGAIFCAGTGAYATSITFDGNSCQGGSPFVRTLPGQPNVPDPDQTGNGNYGKDCSFEKTAFGGGLTPLIFKADVDEAPEDYDYDANDGKFIFTFSDDVLGYFPTIDGDEFTVWQTSDKRVGWSYNKGIGDPTITVVALKGGNSGGTAYQLNPESGDDGREGWVTSFNGNSIAALSNITFFDSSGVSEVPLPAAGWMLIAGVGGLAAMRRRRKA